MEHRCYLYMLHFNKCCLISINTEIKKLFFNLGLEIPFKLKSSVIALDFNSYSFAPSSLTQLRYMRKTEQERAAGGDVVAFKQTSVLY